VIGQRPRLLRIKRSLRRLILGELEGREWFLNRADISEVELVVSQEDGFNGGATQEDGGEPEEGIRN